MNILDLPDVPGPFTSEPYAGYRALVMNTSSILSWCYVVLYSRVSSRLKYSTLGLVAQDRTALVNHLLRLTQ